MPFELDTGNTAWLLMSAGLVLLMTVPALAFFYGGLVRAKSVLNMMMMSFGATAIVGIIWVLWGYSAVFGADQGGVIGNPFEYFGLNGLTDDNSLLAGSGVPALVAVGFQMTFAIITVALISGAIADRTKFGSWLVFAGLWVTLVYLPIAHMVWGGGLLGPDGPIAKIFAAPIDFAGGAVVHINAGVAALVLALIIGKRAGFGSEQMRPHNLPFVMLGAGLLWFGWFGFNAGSAGAANETAGLAWLNTAVCTCAAIGGWLATERIRDGHPTSLGAASGVVAGLVAITPAAAALTPVTSIALGLVAGAACAIGVGLKYKLGVDDSLDVVGVHLIGGLVGTIAIGFLATDSGLFFGHGPAQLLAQLAAAGIAIAISAIGTAIIGFAVKATLGLRANSDAEIAGVDLAIHSESAYDTTSLAPFTPNSPVRV